MECINCNLLQRKFFCPNCVKIHLRDTRAASQHVALERSQHIEHAAKELPSIDKARKVRAEISRLEERVAEVRKETQRIKAAHDAACERISKLKMSITQRRSHLTAAQALPPPSQSSSLQSFHSAMSQMTETLAHTRAVLLEELLDVFDIVEVGGRPSLGGTKGAKGEWMIGGLVLPVPGDMSRYPPEHINAALTHTLHFLGLITFYLGIKLPFEVTWNGESVGVGCPYISAGKGSDLGGWARWTTKQPLHILPSSSLSSSTAHGASAKSPATSPSQTSSQSPSFTTALTMLLYNILYLCHTQSLTLTLSQSGDILHNLWALCCAPELGRRSHQTGVGLALEQPTPPTFTIEFTQLLQATSAGPAQRKKRRIISRKLRDPPEEDDVEEWDLVEPEI